MGRQGVHRQHDRFRKGYVAQDAAVSSGKRRNVSFRLRNIRQGMQVPVAGVLFARNSTVL